MRGDPSDSPSDEELVAAIADGDREALQTLYRRHQPWLTARLRHRCSDPDVIAEAVQDTFVAVWKGAGKWSGVGEPAAWIWGIGIRRLIGVLRHRSRWAPPTSRVMESATLTSAEDLVLFGVGHGDLAGAIDQLPAELRAVVQATILDGLTTREAGRLLGIPAGTVKTRMSRARIQLRGALT
jgi:RNA polymerase sigma-70 factor, ECF subfamily